MTLHTVSRRIRSSASLPRAASCLAALLLIGLAAAAPASEDALAGSRPNIILVMTDDQGYGQMAAHGHPFLKTPNLDRLYQTSTRFTQFQVDPTCAPTRSALMTGRYPFRNGITHTILERERMTLSATTVAQLLQQAGYTTGIFGKWHLGDEAAYQPEKRGFDEVFIHGAGGIGQAYDSSCADAPNNSYFDPVIRHNGRFVKTQGFCTDVFFTQALGWIKQQSSSEKPFFAYITTNAPHSPFVAPKEYTKRFEAMGLNAGPAGFYGMVENIDHNLGRLLDKLDQWKLNDNTLLIFLSDNGTTGLGRGNLGTDRDGKPITMYNAGMKGMKGSPEEGGTRVPAFFRWNGRLASGRDIDTLAAHIDMLPTLLEFAGAKVPEQLEIDGRSLVPLLAGENVQWPDRYLFFHVGRWPKFADPQEHRYDKCAVRSQRFRLVNNEQLFDMQQDPGQTTNVADKHPEVVKVMREAYDSWWDSVQPLLVNEKVPNAPQRPYHVWYQQQLKDEGIPAWQPPKL